MMNYSITTLYWSLHGKFHLLDPLKLYHLCNKSYFTLNFRPLVTVDSAIAQITVLCPILPKPPNLVPSSTIHEPFPVNSMTIHPNVLHLVRGSSSFRQWVWSVTCAIGQRVKFFLTATTKFIKIPIPLLLSSAFSPQQNIQLTCLKKELLLLLNQMVSKEV